MSARAGDQNTDYYDPNSYNNGQSAGYSNYSEQYY